MFVGRFFNRMMTVVLCLVMQLPLLVMPVAMASAADTAWMFSTVGDAPMMGRHTAPLPRLQHVFAAPMFNSARALDVGGRMQSSPSHVMNRMLVKVQPASSGVRMGDDAAPCCQSHHVSCDAGLLPVGPNPVLPRGSKLVFQYDALRISLRALIVPPWRPPSVLPV